MSRSVPTSNVTVSLYIPALDEVDDMYNIPSTPFTCCSIGVATICAMVVALAPGYCASTTTVGGVIVGYCSTGNELKEITPATTIRMERTVANIGRLMKNLDIIKIEF